MQKKSIGPILFLYYEESLVSSNLNSNLLRFHCAHPNVCFKNVNIIFGAYFGNDLAKTILIEIYSSYSRVWNRRSAWNKRRGALQNWTK